MNAYFAFTDESGNYHKERNKRNLAADPFHIRATVIISLEDYISLQKGIDEIKQAYGVPVEEEVKWSHYGNALKGRLERIPNKLNAQQLKEYYEKVLDLLTRFASASIYYTFTDNAEAGQIDTVTLYRMHLQNALQRVQQTVKPRDGFAIVVADDLDDKNKQLKKAICEIARHGDYVKYENIKKGLYIDCSDQCQGLQVADICAGIFAASMKYITAKESEKHKYETGYNLLMKQLYKKVRNYDGYPPFFQVHGYGVSQVPSNVGEKLARQISSQISDCLERDLHELLG